MRKPVLYPVLAVGLGILTAGLRMWQRTAGYDENSLPVPFAAPSVALAVFLLLCAGVFLFLAVKQPKTLAEQSAALPQGSVPAALFTAAGVLVLVGGCVGLFSLAGRYLQYAGAAYDMSESQQAAVRAFLSTNLLSMVLAVSSVPTAAALLLRAKGAKSGASPAPFAAVMPSIFGGVWLISVYRGHTSNPILWDYVLLLLAVAALLASAYERAGFAFGVGTPRRTVFTSHMALLLAVAALPDCGGIANAAALVGLGLQTAAELPTLLSALENAPDVPLESIQQEDAPHESE